MATVLAAASYYKEVFILFISSSVRRVMVPCGSTFHLETGTISIISVQNRQKPQKQNLASILSGNTSILSHIRCLLTIAHFALCFDL